MSDSTIAEGVADLIRSRGRAAGGALGALVCRSDMAALSDEVQRGCKAVAVAVPPAPPRAFGPLFQMERQRLLDELRPLNRSDWERPSPCPGWSVLGLAAHLLGGDFSVLARHRDDHLGTPAPAGLSEEAFIGWLDELQIEWVSAARRLSPRLVIDLLEWVGTQVVQEVTTQDVSAVTASVSWASAGPVPVWLDQARELSERWIHRQQIRQALGRESDLRQELAEPVLDGLRWAYPFRLGAFWRRAGSTVEITVTGPEMRLRWDLVSEEHGWQFQAPVGRQVIAQLQMTAEQAWRLLSNNFDEGLHGEVRSSGDASIIDALMRTRAIVGTPK